MARVKTWEISDAFWELIEPIIPASPQVDAKGYMRNPGDGRKRNYSDLLYFAAIILCCIRVSIGMPYNGKSLKKLDRARSTESSNSRSRQERLRISGAGIG